MNSTELAQIATGRSHSLFEADVAARRGDIVAALDGARVLVIGGAGSIGSSVVKLIAQENVAALHVVDISENSLVELVRDLRSSGTPIRARDLRALPLDYGSPVMHRFLLESAPYQHVMNFAALKHVRSEKDAYSVLQMLDNNVLKQARLLQWLHAIEPGTRCFSVSTDKAANPVNFMGATKRLMEHVMFSEAAAPRGRRIATSARFANVAFSDGSLLQGWMQRLAKRQPLAVPQETRRFFVSLAEAGELCLIAALLGDDGNIIIPRLDPSSDLHLLEDIAVAFLRLHQLRTMRYDDPESAIRAVGRDLERRGYPLLLTPLDTSGEKPFEEFVAAGETAVEKGFRSLLSIEYRGMRDPSPLVSTLDALRELVQRSTPPVSKEALVRLVGAVVDEFAHVETGRRLDERL
jgi:FlaA1/EpsC-like NDP-sugar epimerase